MVSAYPSAGSETASLPPPASLAGTPLFSMPEDGLSVLASAAEMATQESANRAGVSPSPQLTPQVWAPPIPQGWMGSCDVPDKIQKRILDLEYVDVGELLPETWNMQQIQEDQGLQCCHQARTSRRGPVTNLLLWLEGYSILVAILSSKYPQYTGELMAYQRWII